MNLKTKFIKILNRICYVFLILKTKLDSSKKYDKPVAIFSDYLDVSFLLSTDSLKNERVILFCTKRYPFFQLFRTKMFSRIDKVISVSDYSEKQFSLLVDKCNQNGVKVVLIQAGDFLVPAYNYVNSQISNKGNSELAVSCSLDKGKMREMLNQNNISPFKTVDIGREEDINKVDFYPCVLKPKIGTFSEGVILLHSKDEFIHFFQESEKQRRKTEFESGYIVEEYIEGRQFDVEGFIHNGKLVILSIVEENYTGFFPYFNINWFFFNAFVSDETYNKMYNTIQNAFLACGMLHGAYHCELRIDSNGEVRIIEFSNRMGGGFEQPISNVSGNNFAELYTMSMLDRLDSLHFINKNTFLLQKYFQYDKELVDWKVFLDRENISYSFKRLSYRGHIGMLNIYSDSEEIMGKIADKYNLIYRDKL